MYLFVAGVLMALVGSACGLAAKALWRGSPKNWPDVVALGAFVLGGFRANYTTFGDLRPKHTITNVVAAAIIAALLGIGYPE